MQDITFNADCLWRLELLANKRLSITLQVLITSDSVRVHREVLKCIPVLRRLTKSKLNDEQVRKMSEILESFTK